MENQKYYVSKNGWLATRNKLNQEIEYVGVTLTQWKQDTYIPLPKPKRTTKWKRYYDTQTKQFKFELRN